MLRSALRICMVFIFVQIIYAKDTALLQVSVSEEQGFERKLEYVEFSFQLDAPGKGKLSLVAENTRTNERIPCQVSVTSSPGSKDSKFVRVIFPVSIEANGQREFIIKSVRRVKFPRSKLELAGKGFELTIENEFYKADLTKDADVEPQSHNSGQIRELLIKLGLDQLISNDENRIHWSPNFDRPEVEWYTTMAHWNFPELYELTEGPYQIRTIRQDVAAAHPEILLTGTYDFYEGLPYFRFYSGMEMKKGVWLELLRNDEMAMDSMFTHLAFQRPDGEVIDIPFSDMYPLIKDQPIENESPWICFYSEPKGFAIGSIRVMYDNTDIFGDESILYEPHTQIGEWEGSRYWNRRLIHDHLTFVSRGSRYQEDCAYLVFKIDKDDPLNSIKYWADRVRNPLAVDIEYLK